MRLLSCFAAAAFALAGVGTLRAESALEDSLGRSISAFELRHFRGTSISLDDFADSKFVVVAFLGVDCPLAKFYGPRLQKLADQLRDRHVAFLGIDSNRQDSLAEIAAYARQHHISFPILKDLGNEVSDQFGATRTPEVFVLDAESIIRYQGRVDGTFTFGAGVGMAQPQETRGDLAIALDELLAGKPVSVPLTEAKGCLIGRSRTPQENPTVTYSQQIARIVQDHCLKCHRKGQIAPLTLDSYEEVAGWGDMIAEVVREQRMPPWHATGPAGVMKNDARLAAHEKELLQRWVDEGCPEGDPTDLPPPKKFHEGWFVEGGPDEIFSVSDQPAPIKAEGVEEYRYYEVHLGFKEDKWLKVVECMPGNPAVVHHMIVYARPPGGEPIRPGSTKVDLRGHLLICGFGPGRQPMDAPAGWARLIPANHSLAVEMHYTPLGSPQTDRSRIGLVYMDEPDVTHLIFTAGASNSEFRIPPYAPNHRVEAQFRFRRDTIVTALSPHLHMRGKSFRYELVSANGERELLLDIPYFDFNWQNSYVFSTPRTMSKGSRMECVAYFDNSAENLANPDPSQEVRWGPQTWDEMMVGFIETGVPKEQTARILAGLRRQREKHQ